MNDHRVNARALAEFTLENGDLRPVLQAAARMQEGARVHRLRQAAYAGGLEKEVWLSFSRVYGDIRLTVQGRADGLNLSCDPPVLEEIKSTRLNPDSIGENDYPAHFAQAEIYAYMACEKHGLSSVEIHLIYVHLNGDERDYERTLTRENLAKRFDEYARPYAAWLARLDDWRQISVPAMRALTFPYAAYREGQRKLAGQTYLAVKNGRNLLAQAPTGIGKTMAVLFAAIKAMGEGLTERVFYLTARTTTRRAAEDALRRMRAVGLRARSITLTAKEKLCPFPDAHCDPALCPRAVGYFDRRRPALEKALTIEEMSREAVEKLAAEFDLCPFELQLDASENAEVIICDYNYAFDPRVKLRRFFIERTGGTLLVDEAHNLIERAREMRSATVRQRDYTALKRAIGRETDKRGALYESLARVVEAFKGLRGTFEGPCYESDAPESLGEALEIFLDAAAGMLGTGGENGRMLADRYFEAQNYGRVAAEMTGDYRVLYEPDEKNLDVTLWCYHPGAYLASCYKRVRGAVLFSATLTPLSYYRNMLGLNEDAGDLTLDLPSPFPPENLLTLRVPIATTYRRREETASRVAEAILAMCRAKKGNYLACFPSHAYLALVARYVSGATDVRVVCQQPRMTEREREAFIQAFRPDPPRPMLALIAMGGVFAEGVDLPGELLSGAAIVGVGIPQISLKRAALVELLGMEEEGVHYAYTYPGLERVMQAAGRVIRTETDRGVILLLDERFFLPEYEELLPAHWQARSANDPAAAAARLKKFWQQK